jgi:hypothetical protein
MNRFRKLTSSAATYGVALGAAAALFAGLAGCAGDKKDEKPVESPFVTADQNREFDAAIVRANQNDIEASGIIRQHTIYPYHFVPDSATLNELGQRDVAVLAHHYASLPADPGVPPPTMSVRRGDASPGLYDARVRAVTAELARGGVANDHVRIADAAPGGDGMIPGKVKIVIQRDYENKPYFEDSDKKKNYNSGGDAGMSSGGGGGGGSQ